MAPLELRLRRRRRAVVLAIALLALGACTPDEPADYSSSAAAEAGRRFGALGWDTVLMVGGRDPNDTTLLLPARMILWGERIAVLDWANQTVRVLSRQGGLLWSVGARGGGPSEFGQVSELGVAPNRNLWLHDSRNVKIMEFDTAGDFVRSLSLQHLPVPTGQFLVLRNRLLLPTQFPGHGVLEAEADSARVLRSWPFPWPDPLDARLNIRMIHAVDRSGDAWVMAFLLGPGFMVFRRGSAAAHRYIEPIPYALKSGPQVQAMGADSARFGALAASIVGDEIYFLFGGRPRRRQHPLGEPTELLDVYGLHGEYRRSYRFGTDTHYMVTEDGRTFYVLTETEDGLPTLLGLRVREE